MRNLTFNLFASLSSFMIAAFLALIVTPYIIKNLGVEAYGFIPLIQSLISILTILTISISAVIARFITIAMQQNNIKAAQEYFNTYLFSSIFGSGIIFILISILIIFANQIFNIPGTLLYDVRLGIFLSGMSIIISMFNALFMSAAFYFNKLYITSFSEIINVVVKGILTISLLFLLTPQIWFINLAGLVGFICSLLINVIFFRGLLPSVKIKYSDASIKKFRELIASGSWVGIAQVGIILFTTSEIILANIFLGSAKAGIYAAMIQFPLLLRSICSAISSVFSPMIVKLYGENKISRMTVYANKSVEITGLIIALPASILISFSEPILNLWLGYGYSQYSWILIFNVIYLVISLKYLPLSHVFTAYNKLKVPGYSTIILGLFNVISIFILLKYTNLQYYALLLSGATTLVVKNAIFTPLYCSWVTKKKFSYYYTGSLKPTILTITLILVSLIGQIYFEINTLLELMISITSLSLVFFLFIILYIFKAKKISDSSNVLR